MFHDDLNDEKLTKLEANMGKENLYSRRKFIKNMGLSLGFWGISGSVGPKIAHSLFLKGFALQQTPPEPTDGIIIDDMNDDQNWQVLMGSGAIAASTSVVAGHEDGQAIRTSGGISTESYAFEGLDAR